jgi:hypothetical protein
MNKLQMTTRPWKPLAAEFARAKDVKGAKILAS